MNDYASQQGKSGKRLAGLGLVVGLHVLVFWAINSGLARAVVKKIQAPVEAVLLEEIKPPPPPPPHLPAPLPPRLSSRHRRRPARRLRSLQRRTRWRRATSASA